MSNLAVRIHHIPERHVPGKRLGRHVEHDPSSRGFDVQGKQAHRWPLTSRSWPLGGDILDQGELGSCTGEAGTYVMNSGPFLKDELFTQDDAVVLYSEATHLDRVPGVYPPTDTGSSGLAVMKVLKKRGLISGYSHAFSLRGMLEALSFVGPVMIGIDWFEGFDNPRGSDATLEKGGEVRGGHELAVLMIDVENRKVRGPNSWSKSWGASGWFSIGFDTMEMLLDRRGDVQVPHA